MAKAILLSPHLDDAALSCSVAIRNGLIARVVTVFGGLPPADTPLSYWDRITRAASAYDRARERKKEDKEAWESVGQEFQQLDFAEAIRDAKLLPEKVAKAIASICEGYGTVYIPAGIGGHIHHILVRDMAILNVPAQTRLILYADLPYAAFYGWPSDDAASIDVHAHWEAVLQPVKTTGYSLTTKFHELSSEERDWKLKLLSRYRTQYAGISGGSLDLFRTTETLKYEVEFEATRAAA
jgi:hypothetical protein